jgi:hypothetical protein
MVRHFWRRAAYTGLPPDEYVFEVKAIDRDLNYSPPVSVRLIVHPPYGQIALVGGLGLALVGLVLTSGYAIWKRRNQHQAERALMQELEEELQTAHDLQMGLMPKDSPQIEGFDVAGRCLPANHVGGDLFQYFPQDGNLAICMADVTGHGMEAAVPVMMFSGILDTQMEVGDTLEELFGKLNRSLCRNLADSRTYVCFSMGELYTATIKFRLSNSGCPYPYHYQTANGEMEKYLRSRSTHILSEFVLIPNIQSKRLSLSQGIASSSARMG